MKKISTKTAPTPFQPVTWQQVEEAEMAWISLRSQYLRSKGWEVVPMQQGQGEFLLWQKSWMGVQIRLNTRDAFYAEVEEEETELTFV